MASLTDAEPKTIQNIKNLGDGVFCKLEENAKLKLGDPNLRHYAELLLGSIEVELGRRQLLKKSQLFMAHAKEDEILACAEKANICLESGFMKIDCGLILDLAAKEIKKRNQLKPKDLHESLDIDIYLSDFDDDVDDYDYSDWDAYFEVEQEIYREEGGVDDRITLQKIYIAERTKVGFTKIRSKSSY